MHVRTMYVSIRNHIPRELGDRCRKNRRRVASSACCQRNTYQGPQLLGVTAVASPKSMAAVARDAEPATSEAIGGRDTDFSVVVGVDHYPLFRSLNGAIADAEHFHAWLLDANGGGVAEDHARLVRSRPDPISPLQDEVDQQLLDVVKIADAIGGGRRLYFHFSGHGAGAADESKDVALLLAKWSYSLARLALSKDEYHGVLNGMGLFEEIVISLDCCRAAVKGAVGLPPTITHQPRAQPRHTRTFIAYATEHGQSAFESPDDKLWQGVFTRCLLAILRGAPHGITAAALKHELEYAVTSRGQRAHVINGLRDDSRFGHGGVLPRLLVELKKARGRVRLRDGRRVVLAEHDVSSFPTEHRLEAGLYKLEDDAGHAVTLEHVGDGTHVIL